MRIKLKPLSEQVMVITGASSGIYGEISKVPTEDEQAVFNVNFWGTVHGIKEAVSHLRSRVGTRNAATMT